MTDTDLRDIRATVAALKVIVHSLDAKLTPPATTERSTVRAICDALENAGWDKAKEKRRANG